MSQIQQLTSNQYIVVHEGRQVNEINDFLKSNWADSKRQASILAPFWNFLLDNSIEFHHCSYVQLIDFLCALQIKTYINPPAYKYFIPTQHNISAESVANAIETITKFYQFHSSSFPALSIEMGESRKEKLLDIVALAQENFPPLLNVDRVLKDCTTNQDKLIILLAVKMGLRTSEIIDLTLGDVNIGRDRSVMVVNRQTFPQYKRGRDRQVSLLAKDKSEEHLAFSGIITDYLATEYPEQLLGCADNNFLVRVEPLQTRFSKKLTPSNIAYLYAELRDLGHNQVRCHRLRHQFILDTLNYGVHEEYLLRIMGSSSIQTVRRQIKQAINFVS